MRLRANPSTLSAHKLGRPRGLTNTVGVATAVCLSVSWRIAALAMVTSPTETKAEADNEDSETMVATKLPLRQMTAIL